MWGTAPGNSIFSPTFRLRDGRDDSDLTFTEREAALLLEGLDDDVSFFWALIHLGIRTASLTDLEPPGSEEIELAFRSFERLTAPGYCHIGHITYVDSGREREGVVHVAEPLEAVRTRVETRCSDGSEDWVGSCWLVNTQEGNDALRSYLRLQA
jgi:hypothetical protein